MPNIKGKSQWASPDNTVSRYNVSGAFGRTNTTGQMGLTWASESAGYYKETFDASQSNSTYQDNAPVQQKAIQVYLEFYLN